MRISEKGKGKDKCNGKGKRFNTENTENGGGHGECGGRDDAGCGGED
jgi:hypothetical protein